MNELYCDYGLEDKTDYLSEEELAFIEQSKEDWQTFNAMHQ